MEQASGKAKWLKRLGGVIAAAGLSLFLMLSGCEQFGAIPKGADHERMKRSENYDVADDRFVNRAAGIIDEMMAHSGFWANPRENLTNNFLFNPNQTRPDFLLPDIKGAIPEDLRATQDTVKFAWLGHATVMASIKGQTVLFDPVFAESASPVSWAVTRYQPPVLKLEDLPAIDLVVISHDHYDHLDMQTIKFLAASETRFLVPLGVAPHLQRWGIEPDRITEFDWWQSRQIGDITFICTPAQHFSGRTGTFRMQKSLWSSWVVKTDSHSVYFSGDSGYSDHYAEIGARYGPFDLTFIDAGQYNKRWRQVHNLPPEVVDAYVDLQGKILVPIGWGMFTLALHNWYDPPVEVSTRAAERGLSVTVPKIGEWVDISQPLPNDNWWIPLIEQSGGQ